MEVSIGINNEEAETLNSTLIILNNIRIMNQLQKKTADDIKTKIFYSNNFSLEKDH